MNKYLTKEEIEGLPALYVSQIPDTYISSPHGLLYDGGRKIVAKMTDFKFVEGMNYDRELTVLPITDFEPSSILNGPDPEDLEEPDDDEDQRENQTNILIDLILDGPAILFHDQFKTAMIAVEGDGRKILKLRSRDFKSMLAYRAWSELKIAVASSVLDTVVRTLEGKAIHEGCEYELGLRAVNYKGDLWYDLGTGKAVKITDSAWEITDRPPILFSVTQNQKPQVMPTTGGDIQQVFNFLPEPENSDERTLLLIWIVAAFMQGFAHPILTVFGEQGSRKTTLFKMLRKIIDPSSLGTVTANADLREFIQQASHNFFLPLDNLSFIKDQFSDVLCRVVTGEGFSKRELFSDDDDIIYSFQRVMGINGINLVSDKPDLLDRSLIIRLTPPQVYQEEEILFAKFEQALPSIMGSIFDLIVKARNVVLPQGISGFESFRMAGFVKAALRVSLALGYSAEALLKILQKNRGQQHAVVIEASPLVQVVQEFMSVKDKWSGQATQLYNELLKVAAELNIDHKQSPYPKSPSSLSKKLWAVQPTLRALGIDAVRGKDGDRFIYLVNKAVSGVGAVPVDKGPDGAGYSLEQIADLFEGQTEIQDSKDALDVKDYIL